MILNIWVDFLFLFELLHKIDHLWFYNQKSQFTLLVFHFYCHNSCYVFNVLRMSKYFLYIKTKNSFFPYLYQWMLWEMHMVHKLWFLCISEYERWIGNKPRVWSRAPEAMWTWIPAVCDLKFLCCVGNLDFVRLLRGYNLCNLFCYVWIFVWCTWTLTCMFMHILQLRYIQRASCSHVSVQKNWKVYHLKAF